MKPAQAVGEPREIDTTLDAFHRERFWLLQPAGRGHRAGMDAMVLASAVPSGFSGTLADLGAGAGAAGFAVISRCPQASAVLIERDPVMAELASSSIGLEQNADLGDRLSVLVADVTLSGNKRGSAGLADRSFDYAVMNPPFNDDADRRSPDELKRDAHVMVGGMLDAWIKTAAAILRPGGGFALIARPASLGAILTACEGRFGGLQLKPVHAQADGEAIRIVVRGRRGSKAALAITPPLILHDKDKKGFTALADDLCNGRQTLFAD